MNAPTVLLLDSQFGGQNEISFLLGVCKHDVRSFTEAEECLNWLSIMRETPDEILAVVVNSEIDKERIDFFLSSFKDLGFFSPVLIVDMFRSIVRKHDFLGGVSAELPFYVCEPSELTAMLNHFSVLKSHLVKDRTAAKSLFIRRANA